jgi:cytochrome c
MTFAGLRSAKQRLDLIAYMRTWSDKPYPLPAAKAAPADSGKKAEAKAGAKKTAAKK